MSDFESQLYDIAGYHYDLPEDRIAQKPTARRDDSRLLVVDIRENRLRDRKFTDIRELFLPGDLLVVNDTKVFPARLLGRKESGGRVELLILEYPRLSAADYNNSEMQGGDDGRQVSVVCLIKSSKRPRKGSLLIFGTQLTARVEDLLPDGKVRVALLYKGDLASLLAEHGQVPLPPYIHRASGAEPLDRERYQTVYARLAGAVAAPTAGLHFTAALLADLKEKSVGVASVTLHVGYGTFAPVRAQDIRDHRIHAEYVEISEETARQINATRSDRGRIWAVGTTTVRALEWAMTDSGLVEPMTGLCDLYIYPGYVFRVVDNLITNFHLPGSSLLFMVSALAGRERIMAAYNHALHHAYRFYSYGDAMVVLRR
ncbi:MAG: tRNA preQ1(34) S-adenosylmethionine ribosyltransferase-isomerase QueA [Deltaproteobacteria bacterium RIFOXYD12_FULL_50_9]|nr:MAG: tRNA preQ1(34) S-adenosylmethionine ribosyltransferase-isomerase QueA [Deltaproteobacteria bacterium RIFOXYD12_FULL_50_9]